MNTVECISYFNEQQIQLQTETTTKVIYEYVDYRIVDIVGALRVYQITTLIRTIEPNSIQ